MIIVSQDKDAIVNFDKIQLLRIKLGRNNICSFK